MGLFDRLFPEQCYILQQWNQVKSISYKDDDLALETIVSSIIKSCQNNEKCIVIIPEETLYQKFISELSESHLDQISLFYNPNSSVSKSDVVSLQHKLYPPKNIEKSIGFLESAFANKRLSEQCKDILSSIYFYESDRNMVSVLERCYEISNFDMPEMVEGIMYDLFPDVDENTFESFYDAIVVASKLYQPSYYLQKENRKFNLSPKYVQDEENLELFLDNLAEQIKILEQLRSRYYHFIENDLKQNLHEINLLYQQIKETFEALKFYQKELNQYNDHTAKSGLVSLFTTKSKIKVTLEEKCKILIQKINKLFIDTPGLHELSFSFDDHKNITKDTHEIWSTYEQKIELWYSTTCKNQRLSIKNSNIFNQKNKDLLQELDDELKTWSTSFNQSHFFDASIEINTLSTQKQVELVNELILQITYIYNDVQDNKGYYLWYSFLHNQPEWIQKSILLLQNFSVKYWPDIVEYSYLLRWVSEKKNPNTEILRALLEKYEKSERTILYDWTKDFVKTKKSGWTKRIQNLPKNDKTLYNDIQQNKNIEKLNWRYFFEKNAKFWANFFDIIVTTSDNFEDMEFGHFTQFFYVNSMEINTEVLHLGKTIHCYYRYDDDQVMSTDIKLFNTKNPLQLKTGELLPLNKLNIAKNLAFNFYSLQNKFSILQLKNASIISCFSLQQNAIFKEYFFNDGIKEITLGAHSVERLIECIVETDRKPLLLLPDHLLNPSDTGTISVQLSIICDFEKAGFSLFSLETEDIIKNGYRQAVKLLCNKIKESFIKEKV
ncbi:MAG: hypothetical protein KA161_05780 [Saprospiraceae bacterium]|nr:hypothetical protein [Saprospiraceae bacterium]